MATSYHLKLFLFTLKPSPFYSKCLPIFLKKYTYLFSFSDNALILSLFLRDCFAGKESWWKHIFFQYFDYVTLLPSRLHCFWWGIVITLSLCVMHCFHLELKWYFLCLWLLAGWLWWAEVVVKHLKPIRLPPLPVG